MRIIKNLICPIDKVEIAIDVIKGECISTNGKKYPIINGKPILIDFDNSLLCKSEYYEREGKSTIDRVQAERMVIGKYLKQLASPTHKQIKSNIKHIISQFDNYESVNVLIVGGGTVGKGCEFIYNSDKFKITSCDVYDSKHVDIICDGHSLPFKEGVFDLVIIQYVLEHVLKPNVVVNEIFKVLKDNGIVYAETPFLEQVHEGAFDFTRFTESGHRYLFKQFECIESGVIAGPGTHLLWTLEYTVRGLFRSRAVGKAFKIAFFWLRFLDSLIPANYQVDAADSVYFIGRKNIEFVFIDSEIINHYKGSDQKG